MINELPIEILEFYILPNLSIMDKIQLRNCNKNMIRAVKNDNLDNILVNCRLFINRNNLMDMFTISGSTQWTYTFNFTDSNDDVVVLSKHLDFHIISLDRKFLYKPNIKFVISTNENVIKVNEYIDLFYLNLNNKGLTVVNINQFSDFLNHIHQISNHKQYIQMIKDTKYKLLNQFTSIETMNSYLINALISKNYNYLGDDSY